MTSTSHVLVLVWVAVLVQRFVIQILEMQPTNVLPIILKKYLLFTSKLMSKMNSLPIDILCSNGQKNWTNNFLSSLLGVVYQQKIDIPLLITVWICCFVIPMHPIKFLICRCTITHKCYDL